MLAHQILTSVRMTDDTIAMKTILVKTAILDNNVTSITLLLASDNELCGEDTQNNKMHYNFITLFYCRECVSSLAVVITPIVLVSILFSLIV